MIWNSSPLALPISFPSLFVCVCVCGYTYNCICAHLSMALFCSWRLYQEMHTLSSQLLANSLPWVKLTGHVPIFFFLNDSTSDVHARKNIISIVWWEQHGLWNQAEPGWVRVVHGNWVISGTIMGHNSTSRKGILWRFDIIVQWSSSESGTEQAFNNHFYYDYKLPLFIWME